MAVFQFAEGGTFPSAMHFSGKGELFPVHLRYYSDDHDSGVHRLADGGMPTTPNMSTGFAPYAYADGLTPTQPNQVKPGLSDQTPAMAAGLGAYPHTGSVSEERPSLGTTPQQNSPYTLGISPAAPHTAQAPAPPVYAKGGVASAANKVKSAGRYGDTEIIHVNKEELEELKQMWGPPTINPETGQPEFFLKELWSVVKKVAPIAALFIPVIGPAVGGMLATAAGAVGAAGLAAGIGAHAALIGSAVAGSALGAVNGGAKGAVIGGITGALSAPAQAANKFGAVASKTSFGQNLGMKLGIKNPKLAGLAVGAAGSLLGNALINDSSSSGGAAQQATSGAPAVGIGGMGFNQKLPTTPNYLETINPPANASQPFRIASIDYSKPGFGGGYKGGGDVNPDNEDTIKHLISYYQNGGHLGPGPVKGIGSGQEDKIPAWLSDGEYVWSAQDVADLGDGSTDEGVRRLDKMRKMVRQQAGRKDVKKIAKPQRGIDHMLKAVGGLA